MLPLMLALLSGCGGNYAALRMRPDLYPDYAALRAANTEGRDFSREIYDRKSRVSVFAIHGGDIEFSTSRLARAVAGSDFNLYLFNGWLGGDSWKLHVTAVHFDDPAAVALSTSSLIAVSIHARADGGERVCVGGADTRAVGETASGLLASGFSVETPCRRTPGVDPRNIVNRAVEGGVQLELTPKLLARLENSPAARMRFAGSVRDSLYRSLPAVQDGVLR
ncbi:MAG: poly-gamma-glutamate hydrolase family protein [Elusimicrobiales bacterium]